MHGVGNSALISVHPSLQPSALSMPDCGLCADTESFPCYIHRAYYRKFVFIRDEKYIFLYFFRALIYVP